MAGELVIRVRQDLVVLPDNTQWTNRFEITGRSGNIYIIAQHKSGRYWGCDCFGWKRHKHCRHLEAIGLPGNYRPYEARIEGTNAKGG